MSRYPWWPSLWSPRLGRVLYVLFAVAFFGLMIGAAVMGNVGVAVFSGLLSLATALLAVFATKILTGGRS